MLKVYPNATKIFNTKDRYYAYNWTSFVDKDIKTFYLPLGYG